MGSVAGVHLRLAAVWVLVLTLAGCSAGAQPTGGPPSTEAVFSGTRSEYTQAMADCLKRLGLDASVAELPDGSTAWQLPAKDQAQVDRNMDAIDKCQAELPTPPEPQNEHDFRVMYDHLLEQSQCVSDAGYDVPPVMSWPAFLEAGHAHDIDWDPTALVPAQLQESVRTTCGTDPDLWW